MAHSSLRTYFGRPVLVLGVILFSRLYLKYLPGGAAAGWPVTIAMLFSQIRYTWVLLL